MSIEFSKIERFSFVSRPVPVPADLRINWRVSLVLVMLGESRAKRASLAKLHVLNDAIRSRRSQLQLDRTLLGDERLINWQMRVEPAFGRGIDFVVGERFADWTRSAQRSALQLTKTGVTCWEVIRSADDILVEEKAFISEVGKRVTEEFVTRLLSAGRQR